MARTLTRSKPERTNRLLLIGAVGLAALAAVLIFVSLSRSSGGGGSSSAGDITVVTAASNIATGQSITAGMLSTAHVSKSAAIAGYVTDKASLVGLTALYPIAQGEQISTSKIVGAAAGAGVSPSYIIPQGKQGFAIQVSQTTSPNALITAGDHVDVIAVGKSAGSGSSSAPQLPAALTIVQNVEVLAVDSAALKPVSRFDKDGKPIQSGASDGSIATNPNPTGTKADAKTITLAVTPEQAQQLAIGQHGYTLFVSLRAPGDNATIVDPNKIAVLLGLQ
jgi:pilus assembly protein CpaB